MVKENLLMYSSSLHIFYVLFQCNMDIMSLNNYVLFHINECTMCIFTFHKKDCQQVPTGTDEVIHARCYCDRACLAVTGRSNGRADEIDLLLLSYAHLPFTYLHKRIANKSSPPVS
jgi:hypothetical protein